MRIQFFVQILNCLLKKNNLTKFKNNSITIYLHLAHGELETLQQNQEMQHLLIAFDEEDKFCKDNADLVVNVNLDIESSLNQIINELMNFYK